MQNVTFYYYYTAEMSFICLVHCIVVTKNFVWEWDCYITGRNHLWKVTFAVNYMKIVNVKQNEFFLFHTTFSKWKLKKKLHLSSCFTSFLVVHTLKMGKFVTCMVISPCMHVTIFLVKVSGVAVERVIVNRGTNF
jgi:hypothetical protein